MMNETDLPPEMIFSIDFNLFWVPSAMGLEVPAAAAAEMLGITETQFLAYAAQAEAEVKRTAAGLLDRPELSQAIDQLVIPVEGLVMAVGDSITTYRYSYARLLADMVAIRRPADNIRFLNGAQSGYTSTHGLENVYTQFLAHRPDVVFIMFGVNDNKLFGGPEAKTLVSRKEYQANMEGIVEAFLMHTAARPVLLTPAPVIEDIVNNNPEFLMMRMRWRNADIQAQADVLCDLANRYSLPLVDLMELFGDAPNPEFYLPDGLHPGPAGQVLILEAVLRTLAG
jgi:lysophospholipase L1-like esterase